MTLDLTKPLRIRRSNGSFIEGAALVGDVGESQNPLVVWVPQREDCCELLYQFKRDGSFRWGDVRLENIPEPKVTEVRLWKTDTGGFFAYSHSPAMQPNWTRIGTLRITEVEDQPPKVEVV